MHVPSLIQTDGVNEVGTELELHSWSASHWNCPLRCPQGQQRKQVSDMGQGIIAHLKVAVPTDFGQVPEMPTSSDFFSSREVGNLDFYAKCSN